MKSKDRKKQNCKIAKVFDEIQLNFCIRTGAKECRSCRSRKTLQNATFLAIVAVHTAENEPLEVLGDSVHLFIYLLTRDES